MKVKELIEELSKLDPEKEVWIEGSSKSDDCWEVYSVVEGNPYGFPEPDKIVVTIS